MICFVGGDSLAQAVLIQPSDQKIVAIGNSQDPTNYIAIMRLDTNGTLDTTFSGNGVGLYADGFEGNDGVLTSNGNIVVDGIGYGKNDNARFALIEVGPLGHLNGNFGNGGKVLTDIGGGFDMAEGIALQSDGKIVAAGTTFQGSKRTYDFALARYTSQGKLDKTFGTKGLVITSFGRDDSCHDVAIQSDGKIVAVGNTQNDAPYTARFALARYLP